MRFKELMFVLLGSVPVLANELPELRGQFVCIEVPGDGRSLSLAEVEVHEQSVNLADLKADLSQTTNLYNENPEVVQELSALLKSYTSQIKPAPKTKRKGKKKKSK